MIFEIKRRMSFAKKASHFREAFLVKDWELIFYKS